MPEKKKPTKAKEYSGNVIARVTEILAAPSKKMTASLEKIAENAGKEAGQARWKPYKPGVLGKVLREIDYVTSGKPSDTEKMRLQNKMSGLQVGAYEFPTSDQPQYYYPLADDMAKLRSIDTESYKNVMSSGQIEPKITIDFEIEVKNRTPAIVRAKEKVEPTITKARQVIAKRTQFLKRANETTKKWQKNEEDSGMKRAYDGAFTTK